MIFVFLCWLISLGLIICRFIHVAANGIISFFLWLNSIPLYIHIISSWFISWHFHVLAIVYDVAVNIGVGIIYLKLLRKQSTPFRLLIHSNYFLKCTSIHMFLKICKTAEKWLVNKCRTVEILSYLPVSLRKYIVLWI